MFFYFNYRQTVFFLIFSFYYSDRNKIDIIFLLMYIIDYHDFIVLVTKF